MIGVVSRAGALAPYLRGASATVASGSRAAAAPLVPAPPPGLVAEQKPRASSSHAMQKALSGAAVRLSSGPTGVFQIRFAHTDVKVPEFGDYRRSPDPTSSNIESQPVRNGYTYLVSAGAAITSIYATKCFVHYIVKYMAASADTLAMSKIEIDLNEIPEGKSVSFKWRGKPLFVRHRGGEEIQKEQSVNPADLRDPEHDSARVKDPKWLIVIGVCTHLGCVPIHNSGDYGGYFCPCHGSHYDASGRIRKGPAPLNLEVPPYTFVGNLVVVG